MSTYILRRTISTLVVVGLFLTLWSGCALESEPTIEEPGMAAEAACGSCETGYTAKPNVPGTCAYGYTCECNGDSVSACGVQGGACSQCSAGEACLLDDTLVNHECSGTPCTSGNHYPGEPCMSSRGPGVWGFGGKGACQCCTGCFDINTGVCVMASANDAGHCGTDGGWCQKCGAGTCNSGQCAP